MHGVLKLKTPAHLEAEKAAARKEKLETYRNAMAAIFKLRSEVADGQAHPEKSRLLLKMTGGVLVVNPDVNTLWNIRREVLLSMKAGAEEVKSISKTEKHPQQEQQEQQQELGARSTERVLDFDMDKELRKELELTQSGLTSNPKSYGAWHHRCWTMAQMVSPDWRKELLLCDRYLQLDGRNFHCWDYRRFVVDQSNSIGPAEELAFTSELINENFSNYSAWHYRSKLLPQLDDSKEDKGAKRLHLPTECHGSELNLVQNAAFTDPDDSSAWFYHRWLLPVETDEELRVLLAFRTDGGRKLIVVTSRQISSPHDSFSVAFRNEEEQSAVDGHWESASGHCSDSLWCWSPPPVGPSGNLSKNSDLDGILISLRKPDGSVDKICIDDGELAFVSGTLREWQVPLDGTTIGILEEQMKNCRDLLELEPDSKWAHLTLSWLARVICPATYFEEVANQLLPKLETIDSKRKHYYQDQRSKLVLSHRIFRMFSSSSDLHGLSRLDLSGQGLSCLYFQDRLAVVEELDISNNKLKSIDSLLPYLVSCKMLKAASNLVEYVHISDGCASTTLACLEYLSLKGNPIASDSESVQELKTKLPKVVMEVA